MADFYLWGPSRGDGFLSGAPGTALQFADHAVYALRSNSRTCSSGVWMRDGVRWLIGHIDSQVIFVCDPLIEDRFVSSFLKPRRC